MGNRAVITTRKNFENDGVGVYLHWNGGYDSVSAFLKYCELKGYRSPSEDSYGWARLCQVIANFFGGGLSVGIDTVSNLDCDNWDNGVYIIDGWRIVDRQFFHGLEQTVYSMEEMLLEIDRCMPKGERIGEFIQAKEVPTSEVKVGDTVFSPIWYDKPVKHKVVGFGSDKYVNGTNVKGMPYMDLYGDDYRGYDWNINNYILTETVRIAPE